MNQNYLEKLARLAVEAGVNVQKDQTVVLNTSSEALPLARAIVKEAYELGAREAIVNITDDDIYRQHCLKADEEVFKTAKPWKALMLQETAKNGACYISITDTAPDLLKGVDPKRLVNARIAMAEAAPDYQASLMNGTNAWTVIPYASKAWAKKVYPDLDEEKAVEKLWEDLFAVCRIDENGPLENWKKHNDSFLKRIEKLNDYQFEKLHYQNAAGTDLWVEMPENYRFAGGGQNVKAGYLTFPNIPTEEVFSAPKRTGVNGKIVSTMPLNINGSLIEDIVFTFKDGKIVDFDASSGKDILDSSIHMDEGASYLGEIALVPYGTPIQKLNRLFYNTLIDENASCHFAYGEAYPECVEGGQEMSDEERFEKGLNKSKNHVDFMVGSKDLTITGYTKDGKEIPVFVDGKFSEEFD